MTVPTQRLWRPEPDPGGVSDSSLWAVVRLFLVICPVPHNYPEDQHDHLEYRQVDRKMCSYVY